ncbi:flavodoxin domain-containing protein [Isachenkonia alkalipeptolytica]|uniref:Flavodoxin domain-containing protein n=1 Tax=Isachenkonia alkalipeptolytica TaxID=2565777 RepID=A0AA43XJ27_9CLOT|nr:flavodoxin domain-containing protein [Isachenkonia alkalipeptolytica]NBG87144.1 hypothetical protein [Isachenkonia alkalipeptolytica]
MNSKIIYFTKTGHSRKIAKRLEKDLQVEALDVKENPKLENVDLLFVIGGIYGGKSDPMLLTYVENLDQGVAKKAVLMTSSTGMKNTQDQVRQILVSKGIKVSKDEFICKGSFLWIFAKGYPNEEDLSNAVDFGKRQLEE